LTDCLNYDIKNYRINKCFDSEKNLIQNYWVNNETIS